jgi:hypothetical protein
LLCQSGSSGTSTSLRSSNRKSTAASGPFTLNFTALSNSERATRGQGRCAQVRVNSLGAGMSVTSIGAGMSVTSVSRQFFRLKLARDTNNPALKKSTPTSAYHSRTRPSLHLTNLTLAEC